MDDPCPSGDHCCCCGPGDKCCDCGAIMPGGPPRRLSNKIGHKDYRPDYVRVGVKIDGVVRNDLKFYDVDSNVYEVVGGDMKVGTIEPFWRYAETRQMRRARERWEAGR